MNAATRIHKTLKLLGANLLGAIALSAVCPVAKAEIRVLAEYNDNAHATATFKFPSVPPPSAVDAATRAEFTIIEGGKHPASGDLSKLHDGAVPTEEDQPGENFVFDAGIDGGTLLVDLRELIDIKQINTYSWHPNTRGPQVYRLYASDGKNPGFAPKAKSMEPEKMGWKYLARVDTRPKYPDGAGTGGGQHGVSISDSTGSIGKYRYLLFVISATEMEDPNGNTFYSEIDVIASKPGQGPGATK